MTFEINILGTKEKRRMSEDFFYCPLVSKLRPFCEDFSKVQANALTDSQ